MVKIPDADSLGALVVPQTERPLSNYQPGVQETADADLAASVQRFGQTGFKVGGEIQAQQDQLDRASAESQFLKTKLALDQKYRDDPNYQTAPVRYAADLQNALDTTGSTIRNNEMRAEYEESMGRIINYAQDTVANQAHGKMVDAGRASVMQTYDDGITDALAAPDEPTRNAILGNVHTHIDNAAAAGFITQTEAVKLRQTFPSAFATRQGTGLVAANPDMAARLLAPNAPPAAPGLTPKASASIAASTATPTDADTLTRIAQVESGGNSSAINPVTGASGAFQFTAATARQYGLADPTDDAAAATAAAHLLNDNRTALTTMLGRAPTPAELYLAHQQGAAGAAALLSHGDENAVDVMARTYGDRTKGSEAVLDNGGNKTMTAADFVKHWTEKFNAVPGDPGIEADPEADTNPDPGITVTALPAPGAPGDPGMITDGGTQLDGLQGTDLLAKMFPKTGDWRDFLPLDKRAELYREAVSRTNQNNSTIRTAIDRRVQDGLAALDAGQVPDTLPSASEVAAAYPKDPDKAATLNRTLDDARTLGGYIKELPGMTEDQRQAAMTALTPDPNAPGYRGRLHNLTLWNHAVQAWTKNVVADPAGAMLSANPDLQQQFQQATKDPAQFGPYATRALALQDMVGVPKEEQSVLPNDAALRLAQGVMADPSTAPGKLKSMEAQYGTFWPQVWHDLVSVQGGLPPEYQAVGAISDELQAALLARGLSEQGKSGKNLIDLLPPKAKGGASGIDPTIESDPAMRQLISSLSASGASAQMQAGILNSAKTLAYANVVYRGLDSSAASTAAVQAFTSGYEFMPSGGARVPADRFDAVSQNARALVDNLGMPPSFDPTKGEGLVKPGNLDPWNRPTLQNSDGSYSTTSSISIGGDGGEVLIPTVVNGQRLSNEGAIAHYKQTGENFGTFDSPAHADAFATALHNAQAGIYSAHGVPKTQVAVPAIFGTAGMPDREDYLAMLKANPQWITSPKADALWLMDHSGRIVRRKDGSPVAVPFDQPAPVATAPAATSAAPLYTGAP